MSKAVTLPATKETLAAVSFAWLFFVSLSPYFSWETSDFRKSILGSYVFALLLVYVIIFSKKTIHIVHFLQISALLLVASYFYIMRSTKFDEMLLFLKFVVPSVPFFASSRKIKNNSIKFAFLLISFFAIFSIVTWIFVFYAGVDSLLVGKINPSSSDALKVNSGVFYYNGFFSLILSYNVYPAGGHYFSRSAGFLNEPGYFGTILAFCFCASIKFWTSTKSAYYKRLSIIFLLAGTLTLSAAFFFIILIFLLLYRPSQFLLTMAVFSIFFILFSNTEILHRYITDRFDVSASEFHLPKRASAEFDDYFADFLNSNDVVFGEGLGAHADLGVDVSEWRTIIYDFGFCGALLLLSFYLVIYRLEFGSYLKRYQLAFLCIFFLSVYQRPDVLNFQYLFIFYFLFVSPSHLLGGYPVFPAKFDRVMKSRFGGDPVESRLC